jgi:hypothetical protein
MGSLFAVKARATVALDRHLALVETARFVAATLPKRDQLTAGPSMGKPPGTGGALTFCPLSIPPPTALQTRGIRSGWC